MLSAFHNDQALRTKALARLSAAYDEERLCRGRDTPFSLLMNGEPPREAESVIGMPVQLAFLFDGIFLELPASHGPEWALENCRAISRNVDLSMVVPGVMHGLLNAVSKLVGDQIDRGVASADADRQLQVLEDAMQIVWNSFRKAPNGSEDDVKAILRLAATDDVNYLARAAVEAVIVRNVASKKVMLDTDKTSARLARIGNLQTAGMQAMAAVRSAAHFFADDAKRHAIASFGLGDLKNIRLAEENAKLAFLNGMAVAIQEGIKQGPAVTYAVILRDKVLGVTGG